MTGYAHVILTRFILEIQKIKKNHKIRFKKSNQTEPICQSDLFRPFWNLRESFLDALEHGFWHRVTRNHVY